MPLQPTGEMVARFFGATPRAQLIDKIVQMRSDLVHIQQALNAIERRVTANSASAGMQPEFSNLHNWCLSAMESFYAMVWAAYDRDKVSEVIKDFEKKFSRFTSGRSIIPSGRGRP